MLKGVDKGLQYWYCSTGVGILVLLNWFCDNAFAVLVLQYRLAILVLRYWFSNTYRYRLKLNTAIKVKFSHNAKLGTDLSTIQKRLLRATTC